MEMNTVIASNIKQLRNSRDLTQREFAKTAGITRSILANIELNRGTSLSVLEQIARQFHVSVADLVQTEPIVPKSLANITGVQTDYDQEFDELPPYLQSYCKAVSVVLTRHFLEGGNNELISLAEQKAAQIVAEAERQSGQMKLDFVVWAKAQNVDGVTAEQKEGYIIEVMNTNTSRKETHNEPTEDDVN